MANKKFKPDAVDADGDGIVQEGTDWERPVDCCGKDECEDCPVEAVVLERLADLADKVVDVELTDLAPETYVAKDGDTYASIAAAHKPAGVSSFEYAKRLLEANGGRTLAPGVEVRL